MWLLYLICVYYSVFVCLFYFFYRYIFLCLDLVHEKEI